MSSFFVGNFDILLCPIAYIFIYRKSKKKNDFKYCNHNKNSLFYDSGRRQKYPKYTINYMKNDFFFISAVFNTIVVKLYGYQPICWITLCETLNSILIFTIVLFRAYINTNKDCLYS